MGAAIVSPWVNSEAMSVHLAEIGKQVCDGSHAVLICDGAGWHQTGQRLTVPKNITLLRLPPYSPELNPIENVWEYLRGNNSAGASGELTTTSSRPVATPGTGSLSTPSASLRSRPENGHRSVLKAAGIRRYPTP